MGQYDVRARRSAILKTLDIPPASAGSEQLLALVMDDEIDIPSLAQAIQSEPGITARIISIANSAFFSSPTAIHTVEQAMVKVLGLQTVRNLCVGMLTGPRFKTSSCPEFSLQAYWCRALAVAQSAALMAKKIAEVDVNSVYLAGLLHNIGQLLQVHHFPKEMSKLIPEFEKENNQTRLSQERELLGIDSCEAGGWLAKRWQLPEASVHAISYFQDEEYKGDNWQVVRLIGFIVRFFNETENEESLKIAELFEMEHQDVAKLQEMFLEIEKSVSVLAEFLIQNE